MESATRWSLRLLGSFELSDGQARHTRLGTRSAMALLARIAMQPQRSHARESLVDLLWPDAEPGAGRQRLRQTLLLLKQVLEPRGTTPVIDADRLAVRLIPGTLACDVIAFEQAVRDGDAAGAHALYGGELLPGHYDEWISDERLRLEGLLDRLPAPSVIGTAPATGAAPPAAVSAPPPSAPSVLVPAYLSRLVGAEAQVRRVADEVTAHRLVTVLGPGGAGKTRLSSEVARTLAAEGFDYVAFVPLARCETEADVRTQLLGTLHPPAGSDVIEAVATMLADRRSLLVLDNAEQALDATAMVVEALAARLPALHLLVTSRRALGVGGEHEWTLAFLQSAGRGATLAEAAACSGVALFVDRARAARSDFQLHAGNADAVSALVRRLDGLPLAIELAAARVRTLPPQQMLELLDGETSSLDVLARPRGSDRHASMEAAVAWSWRLLDAREQARMVALTVFGGSFGSAASAAVCDEPGIALALDTLAAQSMLRALPPRGGQARFTMLEPVRDFAARQLDAVTARQLRARHRAYWLARRIALDEPLTTMRDDLPDLAAALDSAIAEGVPDDALRIALAVNQPPQVLLWLDLPPPAVERLRQAAEACTDPLLHARGLSLVARMIYNTGRSAEGIRLNDLSLAALDRVEAVPPAIGADLLGAWTGMNVRERPGDPRLRQYAAQATAQAEASGDLALRGRTTRIAALVAFAASDAGAADLLRQALADGRTSGDRHLEARVHYDLAALALRERRFDDALTSARSAAAAAKALDNPLLEASASYVTGRAWADLRRWPEAATTLAEAALSGWDQAVAVNWVHSLELLPRALVHVGAAELALQLSAFAAAYRQRRLGEMNRAQQALLARERARLERLARRVLPARRMAELLEEGEALAAPAAFQRLREWHASRRPTATSTA